MTNTHKVALLLLLAAFSVIGGTLVQLETWGPLATPKFWGVLLGQLLMVEMPLLAAYRLLPDDALDKVDPKRFAKGVGVGLVLLAVLLFPGSASAQSLGVHAMTSDAVAAMQASEPQVSDQALNAAKWAFVGTQTIACGYGIAKAHQIGEDVLSKAVTCASATAGGLVAVEYIPQRWLRFTALIISSAVTGYVNGKAVFEEVKARK